MQLLKEGHPRLPGVMYGSRVTNNGLETGTSGFPADGNFLHVRMPGGFHIGGRDVDTIGC